MFSISKKRRKFDDGQAKLALKLFAFFTFSLILFVVGKEIAQAADLFVVPSAGSYTLGQAFSISVFVSSVDKNINAVSGKILFPADKLEVASLSKSGSIANFWVQEPSFSNSSGEIYFEGIILNPGFIGASGKIITINLKTKSLGDASLNFSSGSVLANDGQGTNVLSSLGMAKISVNVPATGLQASEATTPSTISGAPLAPQITSPTHSDPNKWYSNNSPKFIWQAPQDAIAARILYDKYPNSTPTVLYAPPIFEKQLTGISDGIWYFHAQVKNKNGWGAVSHFRFQIDTKPPEPFFIKFPHGEEGTNPSPIITFNTTDTLSGISNYLIKIGEGDLFEVSSSVDSNPYALPIQLPGKRSVLVQAIDNAGNKTTDTKEFIIDSLEAPKIISYSEQLKEGDLLNIQGTTYPDVSVNIFLKQDGEEKITNENTKSNALGQFEIIWPHNLKNGAYSLWAQITDNRGAKSENSPTYNVIVEQDKILKIGSLVINYLTMAIALLALGFAFVFLFWRGWRKFKIFKEKVKKETQEAELTLHKSFDMLKESVYENIKLLEQTKSKRELTETENKIIKELKAKIDEAEKNISKEIKDID